jgi:hypothetical protein
MSEAWLHPRPPNIRSWHGTLKISALAGDQKAKKTKRRQSGAARRYVTAA